VALWLNRYRAGDRAQVWTEIVGLGPDLRDDEVNLAEADAVAHETMERVRANIESLIEILPAFGYQFAPAPGTVVYRPPETDVGEHLSHLEEVVGVLPLALRAWYEVVGEVSLIGQHPAWDYEYTDALVVQAPIEYVLAGHEQWEAERVSGWDRGAFTIDLSPDYLHKANVSGGPPYSMSVPNEAADGIVLWERHQTTFVNYLRICFRWAGLPGWDRGALDGWASPSSPPPVELAEVAQSLLPI
jgi:hypothetical protein